MERKMKVIDAADWDSAPERDILIGGLAGSLVVNGSALPDCVPRMAEAGLVEYRVVANIEEEAEREPDGMLARIVAAARALRRGSRSVTKSTVYYLMLTNIGTTVAASLAPSEYLMHLVAQHLFSGSALPVSVLTELDRRAGRAGYVLVGQVRRWAAQIDWEALSVAPRPLDAEGGAVSVGPGTQGLVALLKSVGGSG